MKPLDQLSDVLGVKMDDMAVYEEAFTHKSFAKTQPGLAHNERMEFLGDAVLKLIVSQDLFQRLSDKHEGDLSKIRAHIVSDKHLAELASKVGLGDFLKLSYGEERAGGRTRPSNLANVFEALLGALYLDQGFESARSFFLGVLTENESDFLSEFSSQDYKSTLQEHMQKTKSPLPVYVKVGEEGPDHQKDFFVKGTVTIKGQSHAKTGVGRSKKEAEQNAAFQLLEVLGIAQPRLGSE